MNTMNTINTEINLHDVIDTIITTLDARDPYTYAHSLRVAGVAEIIAGAMGLAPEKIDRTHNAAHLHDIGKIGVSDVVLKKPGRLTKEEMIEMQAHPKIGYNILTRTALFRDVADIVLYHHERYDGLGYPECLKGSAIPVESRIIAVADTFDAMTSDRPYRRGLPCGEAKREISFHSGNQFCPEVVAAFNVSFEKLCHCVNNITMQKVPHFAFVGHDEIMHSKNVLYSK
jgi:putative nucleotidyltransferase with HDIG domain